MCYDFTKYRSISGLTISDIGQYLDEGERLSHNLVRFYPQNIISLTLPDYIYWADGSLPNIDEPNCIYELSFIIRYVSESTKQVTGTWSKFKLA